MTALAVDPADPAVVYAGLSDDDADSQAGVFKSTDAGATWERASNGFGEANVYDTSVFDLVIDADTPSTIYAAAACGRSGEPECSLSTVYRTSDGADQWEDVLTVEDNWMSAVVIDPSNAQSIYAGHAGYSDVAYRTLDGGQTWAPFAAGLPREGVFSLVFDGSGALYAGTLDGVFKSTP